MPRTAQPIAESLPSLQSLRAFAPVLLAIGGLGVTCGLLLMMWATLAPLIENVADIGRTRIPRLDLLHRAKYADLNASLAIRNVLLITDDKWNEVELRRYSKSSGEAALALEDFRTGVKDAGESGRFQSVLKARSALVEQRTRAFELDRRGGTAAQIDAFIPQIQYALQRYESELQLLQDEQAARMSSLIEALAAQADQARLELIACGIAAGLTLLLLGTSLRSEAQRQVALRDQQIMTLKTQRDALVGEVHHRIKNHLQGLSILLETHRTGRVDANDAIATLQGHIMALIGVHGLQSQDAREQVLLRDLVRKQVELVRSGFPNADIAVLEDAGPEGFVLTSEQAVPTALVVTELIVNAVKHGAAAPIRVSIGTHGGQAHVSVANRLIAPTALDLPRRRGLGNGLGLAVTLVQDFARLDQTATPEQLTVTLTFVGVPMQEASR